MNRAIITRLCGLAAGLAAVAACFAGGAAGDVNSATGDTCTAAGNGTSYTLSIEIPSNAPQQFGFAFGAAGTTVSNIDIQGTGGAFSTTSLPAKTSGAWITLSPMMPGSAVASLATEGQVKGSFSVMPASSAQPQPAYFDAIPCTIATAAHVPSNVFSVNRHVAYDAPARAWHLSVSIPGAGTVTAIQPEPSIGTAYPKSVKTSPALIEARSQGLKSPGSVTLTLRPTAQGQVALAAKGSIKVTLDITFDPRGGKSASKLMQFTLRK